MAKREYKVTYTERKTAYIFAENHVEADAMAVKEIVNKNDTITLQTVEEVKNEVK